MPVRKQASLGSKDFGLRSSLSSDDLATPGDSNATNATAGPAKKNKISVVVRKRPLNSKENGTQDILACHGNTTIIREPKLKVDLTKYTENHEYVFDQCFDEKCTNAQVYDQSVKPLVHACLVEGKTFTMMGIPRGESDLNPGTPGIFQLAADDIFSHLVTNSEIQVSISFFEIYCGKLHDLMNEREVVHARADAKGTVHVRGLAQREVATASELMQLVQEGLLSRTTGVTGANVDSSRSHAILQVCLRIGDKEHGRLSFIDLAGSERAIDAMDSDRQTKIDGAEINKSLLALKECIRALGQQHDHTPFRGSKLTQVLKDSFIGDSCQTVMIANVSPSCACSEHTLNTLRYAYRVKELRRTKISSPLQDGVFGDIGASTEFANGVPGQEDVDSGTPSRRQSTTSLSGANRASSSDLNSNRLSVGSIQEAWPPIQEPEQLPSMDQKESNVQQSNTQPAKTQQTNVQQPNIHQAPRQPSASKIASPRKISQKTSSPTRRLPEISVAPQISDKNSNRPSAPHGLATPAERDEMQHKNIIDTVIHMEEELISCHHKHVHELTDLMRTEVEMLHEVDRPGSNIDTYVEKMQDCVEQKLQLMMNLRDKMVKFQDILKEEARQRAVMEPPSK